MVYRTQATILTQDNVPANFATNTWHALAPDLAEVALWHTALATFYNSISDQFGVLVKQTNPALEIQSYDLDDPTPRYPVLETTHSLSPDNTGSLPPEVAICLSFQAPRTSGVAQARRRNRVYLPFLKASTNGSDGRPTATLLNDIDAAATALLAASGPTSGDWQWVIYSPTDDAVDLVDNGWIDNEWDTQRRRGREATSRVTF